MRIATPWHFGKALIQCYSSLMCLIQCEMTVDVLWMSRFTFRLNFKFRISSFKTCTTDDSAPTPPRARVENSMPTLPKNVFGSPLMLARGRIWDKLCKLFEALRILATAIRIVDIPVSYPAHPRILSFHLKHMLKKNSCYCTIMNLHTGKPQRQEADPSAWWPSWMHNSLNVSRAFNPKSSSHQHN